MVGVLEVRRERSANRLENTIEERRDMLSRAGACRHNRSARVKILVDFRQKIEGRFTKVGLGDKEGDSRRREEVLSNESFDSAAYRKVMIRNRVRGERLIEGSIFQLTRGFLNVQITVPHHNSAAFVSRFDDNVTASTKVRESLRLRGSEIRVAQRGRAETSNSTTSVLNVEV